MGLLSRETTFLIKTNIVIAAIKDYLVAASRLCTVGEEFKNAMAQMMATHVQIHNHILYMTHTPTMMQKLLLNKESTRRNYPALSFNHCYEIGGALRLHDLPEPLREFQARNVAHCGKLLEEVEEALGKIILREGPHLQSLFAPHCAHLP